MRVRVQERVLGVRLSHESAGGEEALLLCFGDKALPHLEHGSEHKHGHHGRDDHEEGLSTGASEGGRGGEQGGGGGGRRWEQWR